MNNIQAKRQNACLTQEELARKLNLDRSTVAKWETGKALPRADILVKLSKLLNCSIDELIAGE